MDQAVTERQIRKYLLGELGEETEQLEAQLMTNDELFNQLLVLEDELIEDYLRGTIGTEERRAFEKHFLVTSERHEKLRFAEALKRYVTRVTPQPEPRLATNSFRQSLMSLLRSQTPAWRYAFQAIPLVIVAAGLWMFSTIWQLRNEIAEVRTQQSAWQKREQNLQQQLKDIAGRGQDLEQQLALVTARPEQVPGTSSTSLQSLTLTPGLVRDAGGLPRLIVSSTTGLVQLKLESTGGHHERYRVVVQDADGNEVCSLSRVKESVAGGKGTAIAITLPAEMLPSGSYSLKLSGGNETGDLEDLDKFFFRVLRR